MSDDLISRQAAIEALSLSKEMLNRVLDDTDVVGTDREKYSWGLGLIESTIEDIEELSSVQPESCKYWDSESNFCALYRPSAQPERKEGRWIVVSDGYGNGEATACICECSECKDTIWVYKKADRKWNFCPNCGAKMGGGEK